MAFDSLENPKLIKFSEFKLQFYEHVDFHKGCSYCSVEVFNMLN